MTSQAKRLKQVITKLKLTYNGELITSVRTPVNRKTGEYATIQIHTDLLTNEQLTAIKDELNGYVSIFNYPMPELPRKGFAIISY